jgi:hypothetical protein
MRQQLEALPSHSSIAEKLDGIELLKEVKSLAHNYQSQKLFRSSFVEAFGALANCIQDKSTVQEYQEKFQNTIDGFEAAAGGDALANHHGIHKAPSMPTKQKQKNSTKC